MNQSAYARIHRYDYVFDTGPYPNLQNSFYHKLHCIRTVLPHCDWVFWIDDDAFFTNLDVPLTRFIDALDASTFLVMCQGLVNLRPGFFTFLNAGIFLLRNCDDAMFLLEQTNATSLDVVRNWWNSSKFGLFTGGDQEGIVYVLHEYQLISKTVLLPYNAFNTRPWHYNKTATEHFVVHFAGMADKPSKIQRFAQKFGLDDATLLPMTHKLAEDVTGNRS